MKLKHSLVICISAFVFVANVEGASYTTDFEDFNDTIGPPTNDTAEVQGQDGWTIDDSTYQLSFITNTLNTTKSAALGGIYNTPDVTEPTVFLKHAFGSAIGGASISFDFALFDSTNDYSKRRDEFGFTLRGATGNPWPANNILSVIFVPEIKNPTDPGTDTDAKWDLFYTTGGDPRVPLPMAVHESGYYSFYLQFTPDGTKTDFDLTVSGTNTVSSSGEINFDPSFVAANVGMTWNPSAPSNDDAGDNYLAFDNFSAVPEASSSLLCIILATLVTTHHRRRTC